MAKVQIYTTSWCPYCMQAKVLLGQKSVEFEEIDVGVEPARRKEMTERSGGTTVPQIFIDGQPMGGCDELYALERAGELDGLLGIAPGE
jgi:glutaredoxin 3